MNILGISSVIRRVSHACTKAGDRFYEENILNREFTATAHNQKCAQMSPIFNTVWELKLISVRLKTCITVLLSLMRLVTTMKSTCYEDH